MKHVVWFLRWWAYFINQYWPQKCAIPGRTKVRFRYSMAANNLPSETSSSQFTARTGVVASPHFEYVTQGKEPGVYLSNEAFPPHGFLVRTDDTDELVAVPLSNIKILSGFTYAIKAWCQEHGSGARVRDHHPPLIGLEGDQVRLRDDQLETKRTIHRIEFTPIGVARYFVTKTPEEIERLNEDRRAAVAGTTRAHAFIPPSAIVLTMVTREQLVLVGR